MPLKDPIKRAEYQRLYKEKNRDRLRDLHRDYQYGRPVPKRQHNPEYARAYQLKKNFGITLEQYNELLKKQDYCCFICQRPADQFNKNLAVDHDHKTKEIRGLLCTHCNRSVIGRHRDPDIFLRASFYLTGPFTGWIAPKNRPRRRRRKKRT